MALPGLPLTKFHLIFAKPPLALVSFLPQMPLAAILVNLDHGSRLLPCAAPRFPESLQQQRWQSPRESEA